MIQLTLPSKRPVKVVALLPNNFQQSQNLPQTEYLRRNKVIKYLVEKAGYTKGDVVRPVDKDKFDKEGYYKVFALYDNWYVYKGTTHKNDMDVPWPKNDNPLIVSLVNMRTGKSVDCTTNYVVRVNDPKEIADAHITGG